LLLADGWELEDAKSSKSNSKDSKEPAAPIYKHTKSGEKSDPSHGKPVKLVCTGQGNFVALNAHEKSTMFSQCIYWKGKGTVEVTSEGNALCYSGPRRVTLPPGLYTLSSMQKYIQQVLQEHTHETSAADETSSRAVFCFFPANDEKLNTDTLPPGWISRVHDPAAGVCRTPLVSSSTSLHYSHRISGRNDYQGLTGGMCVCVCLWQYLKWTIHARPEKAARLVEYTTYTYQRSTLSGGDPSTGSSLKSRAVDTKPTWLHLRCVACLALMPYIAPPY